MAFSQDAKSADVIAVLHLLIKEASACSYPNCIVAG
jgi:hypothetical protein